MMLGAVKYTPLAKIPLNCFLARTASATVSKETIACPDERPLRSYYYKPIIFPETSRQREPIDKFERKRSDAM
jgi:hypothetical protein